MLLDPPTTEIYTLSLHDALPISRGNAEDHARSGGRGHLPTGQSEDGRRHPPDDAPARRRSPPLCAVELWRDRKSTRLNSSHVEISYAVFCLKKKKTYFQLYLCQS